MHIYLVERHGKLRECYLLECRGMTYDVEISRANWCSMCGFTDPNAIIQPYLYLSYITRFNCATACIKCASGFLPGVIWKEIVMVNKIEDNIIICAGSHRYEFFI